MATFSAAASALSSGAGGAGTSGSTASSRAASRRERSNGRRRSAAPSRAASGWRSLSLDSAPARSVSSAFRSATCLLAASSSDRAALPSRTSNSCSWRSRSRALKPSLEDRATSPAAALALSSSAAATSAAAARASVSSADTRASSRSGSIPRSRLCCSVACLASARTLSRAASSGVTPSNARTSLRRSAGLWLEKAASCFCSAKTEARKEPSSMPSTEWT